MTNSRTRFCPIKYQLYLLERELLLRYLKEKLPLRKASDDKIVKVCTSLKSNGFCSFSFFRAKVEFHDNSSDNRESNVCEKRRFERMFNESSYRLTGS